jgi:hypothetical protein
VDAARRILPSRPHNRSRGRALTGKRLTYLLHTPTGETARTPLPAPAVAARLEPMAGIEPAAYGLRRQPPEEMGADSRTVPLRAAGAGSGSSRIETGFREGGEVGGSDIVARDLLAAAAAWLEHHEASELRFALLRGVSCLDRR